MEIRHFRGILEDNSRCTLGGKTVSTVLIMFMHDMNEKQTLHFGRCYFLREVSNGYFILEGRAKLTLEDAHNAVSYKYAVLPPNGKEVWECLIGSKPRGFGHVNRCLIIPESSIKGNSECIQN